MTSPITNLPHHEITANMTLLSLTERLVIDRLKLVPEMTLLSCWFAVDDETVLLAHSAPDDTFAIHFLRSPHFNST